MDKPKNVLIASSLTERIVLRWLRTVSGWQTCLEYEVCERDLLGEPSWVRRVPDAIEYGIFGLLVGWNERWHKDDDGRHLFGYDQTIAGTPDQYEAPLALTFGLDLYVDDRHLWLGRYRVAVGWTDFPDSPRWDGRYGGAAFQKRSAHPMFGPTWQDVEGEAAWEAVMALRLATLRPRYVESGIGIQVSDLQGLVSPSPLVKAPRVIHIGEQQVWSGQNQPTDQKVSDPKDPTS